MKTPFIFLIRSYLVAAIAVTNVSIIACFYWYVGEYDTAFKLHQSHPERAQIHRTNALWLGMWGGLYGIIAVTAAGFLLTDLRKSYQPEEPDYDPLIK